MEEESDRTRTIHLSFSWGGGNLTFDWYICPTGDSVTHPKYVYMFVENMPINV